MKMRVILSVAVLGTLILGSCGTSNDVVGGGFLQKRKYNKGFYWNRNVNTKDSETVKNEDLKKNDAEEIRVAELQVTETNSAETFTVTNAFTTSDRQESVSNNSHAQSTEKKGKTLGSVAGKSLGMVKNTVTETHEVAKNFKQAMNEKAKVKSSVPGSNGNTGNILMIILLIILIIVVFSLLDSLLGGWLSWLLGIVLLVLIIYFLLRLLGIV